MRHPKHRVGRWAAASLVVASVVLAVSGCTGAGEQGEAGPPDSPSAQGSAEPTVEEASRTFARQSESYDQALDALYVELNKPEPSMPTLRRLAGAAQRACSDFASDLRETEWPAEVDDLAADLARETSKLAGIYQRMSRTDTAPDAVHIAEMVDRRYDHAPAARMRFALNPEE